jgi:hypothetical protein
VTEPQRLALHKAARAALGDAEGDTLMALAPPANTDIATRQALEVFAAQLTTAHVKWTFTIVVAVNGLIGGLTVGYLTLLLR